MVQECRANGRRIGRSARDAHPRSGKILLGSALLVYQCAFGAGLPSRAERTIHPLPVDYARGMGFSSVC